VPIERLVEMTQPDYRGPGFLLSGKTGSGKTTLACLVGLSWVARGRQVQFRSMQDFLADVKATFGKGEGSERDLIRAVVRHDLVILDDLGAERETEWGRGMVRHLIEALYNEGTMVLCTTNMNPQEIRAKYQGRSSGRLLEMMTVVTLNGKNYRPG